MASFNGFMLALTEHLCSGNIIYCNHDLCEAALDEKTARHMSHVDVAQEHGDDSNDEHYIQTTPRQCPHIQLASMVSF